MTTHSTDAIIRLVERNPTMTAAEIASALTPPPQFEHAFFESYRPDMSYPSQQEAINELSKFAATWDDSSRPSGFFPWSRKPKPAPPGVYLDGGFGVGKTHLLAALWHVAPSPKRFGTFMQVTALVGALGYANAVQLLSGVSLLCIDEFELDDPGDTMLMTRLLGELITGGTRVAATSNTPPSALGEGRFAASDFLREIQAVSANFRTVRIDGLDYRRRDPSGHADALVDGSSVDHAAETLLKRGHRVSLDRFDQLVDHLSAVHPSAYVKLIDGVDVIALEDVHELTDQNAALRLVAFIDRVYDAEVPIIASGIPLDRVFDDDMMAGGYQKKYLRAKSRMIALTTGELPPDR